MTPFSGILTQCLFSSIFMTAVSFLPNPLALSKSEIVVEDQKPAAAQKTVIAGQIKIVGNDVTRDDVILSLVGLYPGQTVCEADLKNAERCLTKAGYFEVNPSTGVRPTVSVIDVDGPDRFKDILVTVQEMNTASFRPMVTMVPGGPGFALVLEERNFDITRWPTSVDDLLSGRSFRGAGQKFYLGINFTPTFGPRFYLAMKR